MTPTFHPSVSLAATAGKHAFFYCPPVSHSGLRFSHQRMPEEEGIQYGGPFGGGGKSEPLALAVLLLMAQPSSLRRRNVQRIGQVTRKHQAGRRIFFDTVNLIGFSGGRMFPNLYIDRALLYESTTLPTKYCIPSCRTSHYFSSLLKKSMRG